MKRIFLALVGIFCFLATSSGSTVFAANIETENMKVAKRLVDERCITGRTDATGKLKQVKKAGNFNPTKIRHVWRGEDYWWKIQVIMNGIYFDSFFNTQTNMMRCGEKSLKKIGATYKSLHSDTPDDLFAIEVRNNTPEIKNGQGKLTLSDRIKSLLKHYKKVKPDEENIGKYSAVSVSKNGQSGSYVYREDAELAKLEAVIFCNYAALKKKSQRDCALYAIDHNVVWNFEAASTQSTSTANNKTAEQKLTDLKKLLEKGLITKDEAAAKRKAILDAM